MKYIVSAKEMEEIDAATIRDYGIPQMVLMERAALSVFAQIRERFSKEDRILVIAGRGNNGGDGVALVRMLNQAGYDTHLYVIPSDHTGSEAFLAQQSIAEKVGVSILDALDTAGFDVIVDAIFGTGLKREITGVYADVIAKINKAKAYKVAVDIPSGIDGTTGKALGCAVCADLTVTFGYPKTGHFLSEGPEYTGELVVADIGFPKQAAKAVAPALFTFDDDDIEELLPKRKSDSNKGTYGKVSIIAGSCAMAGASLLSAEAAYRMGSGLVMICTTEKNREIVQTKLPEAVLSLYDEENAASVADAVGRAVTFANVCVIGPGLSTREYAKEIVRQVLSSFDGTLIIDADAINILAEENSVLKETKAKVILTPHLKEMSRLTGHEVSVIKNDLLREANDCANTRRCVTVLKDAHTIVSDGSTPSYMNITGNSGMATGGSGDVLTGMIAGLCAGGLTEVEAARLGVALHGAAGDAAAKERGTYGMLAGDIVSNIRRIIEKEKDSERS